MIRIPLTCSVLACLAAACGSDPSPIPPEDAATTAEVAAEPELPSGAVCTPEAFIECADQRTAVYCLDDGSGVEAVTCLAEDGRPSICNGFEGGCQPCFPGHTRCISDEQLELCNADGQWIEGDDCAPEETGRVCYETAGHGSCIRMCDLAQKLYGYIGCRYWAADLDNAFVPGGPSGYYDAAGANWALVVANVSEKYTAEVSLHDADGPLTHDVDGQPLDLSPLDPLELRVFRMPRRDVNATTVGPLAFRLDATRPVVAYQFNPFENEAVFSNDATVLLPEHTFDRQYRVMTREQTHEGLRGFLTVVAPTKGTEVVVSVTARTLPIDDIPALEPGESFTVIMDSFDVLNIETAKPGDDLTGSMVRATRPVAVFGGSEASNAPVGASCCADHLEHQMFPGHIWSTRYLAARSFPRGDEPDVWRVMAAEDNTQLTTIPPQLSLPVLNAGEWIEWSSWEDFELRSTRPVLLGQFLASSSETGIDTGDDPLRGDPAFMLVPPIEQLRDHYVYVAPPDFGRHFVTIAMPVGATATLHSGSEAPRTVSAAEGEPFGNGEYAALRLEVGAGTQLLHATAPVQVMAYGYQDDVSYGYTAGLNLPPPNQVGDPPGPIAP